MGRLTGLQLSFLIFTIADLLINLCSRDIWGLIVLINRSDFTDCAIRSNFKTVRSVYVYNYKKSRSVFKIDGFTFILDVSWLSMLRSELQRQTKTSLYRLPCGRPCVSDAIHSAASVEESSAKNKQ